MFSAVLDACVLVPTPLTDTLLRLAERDFYRPLWSDRIFDEVVNAVVRIHPDIDEGRIRRRLNVMNDAFEDARVTGWEPLSAGLDLPDPDDRHVLAAALAGRADSIVTFNLKDFPADRLLPHGLEARHPDEFLLDQLGLFPPLVLRVLAEQAAAMRYPATDLAGVLSARAMRRPRLRRRGTPPLIRLTLLPQHEVAGHSAHVS